MCQKGLNAYCEVLPCALAKRLLVLNTAADLIAHVTLTSQSDVTSGNTTLICQRQKTGETAFFLVQKNNSILYIYIKVQVYNSIYISNDTTGPAWQEQHAP